MLISSKLKLAAGVPAVMALVITSALVFSNQALESARETGGKTQALLLELSEVNSLFHSYVLYNEERPKQQFLVQHEIIERLLRELKMDDPEQHALVEQIRRDGVLMRGMFVRLVENTGRFPDASPGELLSESEQRLSGQMQARARRMVSSALRLERLVNDQIALTQRRVTLLVLVLIIGTTVPLTYLLFAMMRTIRVSLARLRRGTEVIAAGDLNYRLDAPNMDELGELARAFDDMTRRLQETTVSGNALRREVEERKRAEHALNEAQARLKSHAEDLEKTVVRRTSKLQETIEELEHFSYAIVHDLRAPLRAMQGFAELLEEECATTGELTLTKQYLRRIQNASHRMDQLITDALSYSKSAHGELSLESVDLQAILDDLVDTYPNLHPDRADIRAENRLPIVLGSEAGLTQCLSNLLGNAVKFATPGVRPQVRLWSEEFQAPLNSSQQNSKAIRLWVEDNGIGIPAAHQQSIFRMFQRASTDHEGTGIGLAIVRKVVQRMGGEVGVESEVGKGSRFWVVLKRPMMG